MLCVWSTLRQAVSATFAFNKVMQEHYSGEMGEDIVHQNY